MQATSSSDKADPQRGKFDFKIVKGLPVLYSIIVMEDIDDPHLGGSYSTLKRNK
jgi:hypothetical protein